jgi:hypothetical protein
MTSPTREAKSTLVNDDSRRSYSRVRVPRSLFVPQDTSHQAIYQPHVAGATSQPRKPAVNELVVLLFAADELERALPSSICARCAIKRLYTSVINAKAPITAQQHAGILTGRPTHSSAQPSPTLMR